jgi:hypothetical protein
MNEIAAAGRFEAACEALLTRKILRAKPQIAALLKVIAFEEPVRELFAGWLAGFNFEDAMDAAVKTGRLQYPVAHGPFCAFVLQLLLRFDADETALPAFLRSFYGDGRSTDEAYGDFVGDVVPRLCRTVLLFLDVGEARGDDGLAQAIACVTTLLKGIEQDEDLDSDAREELAAVAGGLMEALSRGDGVYVNPLLIGAYNTVRPYGKHYDRIFVELYGHLKALKLIGE